LSFLPAVARTKCNERSSRSHSIFQLRINGTNTITELKSSGVLNLIDLAGSERLDKSGASGKQLEETKNINKSLSCLGDVIAALANKDKHVPFRNSTLTYLLQQVLNLSSIFCVHPKAEIGLFCRYRQCFDKDSKTLVFLNLAPEPEHLQESLCTLRFGAKANSAEIGTARKNVK
jgi:kinesin family protein C1